MEEKEWTPFLTHYLRVNKWKVLQMEVHPLSMREESSDEQRIGYEKKLRGSDWFADRHLQEILQLLKETIYTRVSLTQQETISSRPDVMTGQSVRLGFAFKKRSHHQFYLTLHNNRQFEAKEENTSPGQYCPYQIHREKMVVYAMPVGRSGKTGMSKLLSTLNCGPRTSVGISSYFVKSPRKSENTLTNNGSQASQSLPQESTSAKESTFEPRDELVRDSTDVEDVPCILIEDTDKATESHISANNNDVKKPIPEQDIKQTLKKCTTKLSKQYKRRVKATKGRNSGAWKRQKMVEPLTQESLPDLTQSIHVETEEVAFKSTEEQVPLRGEEKEIHFMEREDLDSNPMSENEEISLLIGSDQDSLGSETDVLESNKINPIGTSSDVKQTNFNIGLKHKKTSKIQKGKSFRKTSKITPTYSDLSPVKDCSIILEKLTEEELMGEEKEKSASKKVSKMSPIMAFLKSPLASSSGIRLSKRISEVYSQCDEVINVDEETEMLDTILDTHISPIEDIKEEETGAMRTSIRSVNDVCDLSDEQLIFLVHQNKLYLKKIFQGKSYCGRHQDYKAGGKSRNDLIYQLHFGAFSDEQSDLVMDTLMSIFCQNHKKYLDYLMKVLLPEMFVKIYMEVFHVNYQQAVNKIQDYIGSLNFTTGSLN